jgi:hypothetical protein
MANKCDMFYVRLKSEYADMDYDKIYNEIPERHRAMFAALWNHFQNLPDIISNKNHNVVVSILSGMEKNSRDSINITDLLFQFYGLYRNTSCLQHVIRSTFFDTVLVIQNTISYHRFNIIKILDEDESIEIQVKDRNGDPILSDSAGIGPSIKTSTSNLISESQWLTEDPEELTYLREQVHLNTDHGGVIHNIEF